METETDTHSGTVKMERTPPTRAPDGRSRLLDVLILLLLCLTQSH